MAYLGHILSADGVHPDLDKIQAMVDWSSLCSLCTLRGFLGLTGFYRRFIQNYASHATSFTDLLKQSQFTWSNTTQEAFTHLKQPMTKTSVLALPDFSIVFDVETDASSLAIGAVLS
ncbi:PREDICTED: uncharacterized protein LOC109337926 [Lupinus angustifolius]|uniref:uncharacterized protein LOC109337926 n=1 Tax=Lupinus angustifolius TaxID=3871 RepID=UPI00092F1873|nr:PREDICTED: uncharacterized protein LOC109337926 [Lupinus angustifolius]